MIVLDSCVFIKLLVEEKDSDQAVELIRYIQKNNLDVIIPKLFVYEVVQVCQISGWEVVKILNVLHSQMLDNWYVVDPSIAQWQKAEEICRHGPSKDKANKDRPHMYDSIFHALAMEANGLFITADRRHFTKSHEFGHITLLEDWHKHL